jgi:hypothetical protein
MAEKYTNWASNIPNGNEIDQMGIKFANIFLCKTSEIYPNWEFGFENISSGNPGRINRHMSM